MRRLAEVFLLAFLGAGCVATPQGWDVGDLEARHGSLREIRGHRLGESPPYFALGSDGIALFLCRWADRTPIPVWLPETATPAETQVLGRALSAWEGAGLGVQFDVRTWLDEPPVAGIVFELLDPAGEDAPTGAASTIADCAIPPEVAEAPSKGPAPPVDAELQYASIHLNRSFGDLIGRPVRLSESELLGAAVHELGHALGFPGHVAGGGSVMSAHGQIEATRRWGRRIEAGETLEAPTLVALYTVPSGVRLRWLPFERRKLSRLAELSKRATVMGLRGPWSRVSSESGRLFYRDDGGNSYAAVVLGWGAVQREPSRFEARLNRRGRLIVDTALRR